MPSRPSSRPSRIDWDKVFKQSRYDKGEDGDEAAYVELPVRRGSSTARSWRACVAAEKVAARSFEEVRYFEGCLPIEVMAERGEMTLAFGPMKPVGLVDPRTGARPFAVVQLRTEDARPPPTTWSGFQTRMTYGEQARVFRTIPGLEDAEFLRFGSVHRNTFLNAPELLDEAMQLRARPGVFIAGQLSGVEGYVESAAGGFSVRSLWRSACSSCPLTFPPETTALGGIRTHLARKADATSRRTSPGRTCRHFRIGD